MSNYKRKTQPVHAYTDIASTIVERLPVSVIIGTILNPFVGKQYKGIWDTGCSTTAIRKSIATDLNLDIIAFEVVNTANGPAQVDGHYISLGLPNGVGFLKLRVNSCDLSDDVDILVGMDVIAHGDFAISNYAGNTTITFRTPSIAKTDYVQCAKNQDPTVLNADKTGRNDPCPCGSGKKYKNCCGS